MPFSLAFDPPAIGRVQAGGWRNAFTIRADVQRTQNSQAQQRTQ